jgi:hypothetical protein
MVKTERLVDIKPEDTTKAEPNDGDVETVGSTPDGAAAEPESAPDPFDLNRLTLDQSFAETIGVKRLLKHVPVGKPGNQDWVRVYPRADYRGDFSVIILKNERETYLVSREMSAELASECVPVTIFVAVSSVGVVRLWPVRLPGPDGKDLAWWRTEREGAEQAMTIWTRIKPNMNLGANEIYVSDKMTAEPKWPTETFQELLKIAFAGRLVDKIDHPVVKRLRGLD